VGAVVVVALAGYAWLTAGVKPFTSLSYLLVAVPSVLFVVAYASMGGLSRQRPDVAAHYRRQAHGATLSTVAPWIAWLSAALLLEVIGLLLGGRSSSVPTLSTTIDHLLAMHWERWLFCLTWLLVGALPLLRLHLRTNRDS
jgi:hypothetical protein